MWGGEPSLRIPGLRIGYVFTRNGGSMKYGRFFASRLEGVRASEIRELLKLTEQPGIISFAGGLPDPSLFPREEVAEAARRVALERGERSLQYSPTRGVSTFIDSLKRFLVRHNVRITSEDGVIVTTGSQEALYLLAQVLVDPGDYVVVESPTYLAAAQVFRATGAKFLTVPIDHDGMRTDALEEVLKRARSEGRRVKLIYTVPTCHNPAGTTMPDERRRHLLELAEEYDLLVVEDDPYSMIVFEERPFTHLKTLDSSGRVIYLGSASKILAPGLRIGWAVGPEPIIDAMELLKQYVDLHTSTYNQYIMAEMLDAGLIERNLGRIRSTYKAKRDAMLEALEEHMPEGTDWTKPIGGLFVFVWLPESVDAVRMLPRAVEAGVAYVPGSAFYVDGGGRNTMRLSYSLPSVDEIRRGVEILGRVVREEMGVG